MSKINAENIDEMMFDYFEGNLQPSDKAAVDEFLDQNPEYQIDFNAWRDSYFTAPKDKYPFADQLIAGTGAAWIKWSLLGVLVVSLSATALYYSGNFSDPLNEERQYTASSDISTEITASEDTPLDGIFTSAGETNELENVTTPKTVADSNTKTFNHNKTSKPSDEPDADLVDKKEDSVGKNVQKRGIIADGDDKDQDKTSGMEDPTFGNEEEIAGVTRNSGNINYPASSGNYSNVALTQAVQYFQPNGGGTVNADQRTGRPQDSEIQKNSRKHHHKTLLKRLMDKIIPQFNQPLGLRNSKDPYLVIPEFHTTLLHNASFAGTHSAPRVTMSGRSHWTSSTNSNINSVLAVDGLVRFRNKNNTYRSAFNLGLGAVGSVTTGSFSSMSYLAQEYTVTASPKINLAPNVTLEPAISLSMGRLSANYGDIGLQTSIETSRGMVRQFNSMIEGEVEHTSRRTHNYVDAGLSVLINTSYFYTGLDVRNAFGSSNSTFFNLPDGGSPTISAVIGTDYKYRENSGSTFSPHVVMSKVGEATNLWGGVNASFGNNNKFMIGAGYGNSNEFAGVLGFASRTLRITYKSDYTRSRLLDDKFLSHELTLRFFVGRKTQTLDLPLTEGH